MSGAKNRRASLQFGGVAQSSFPASDHRLLVATTQVLDRCNERRTNDRSCSLSVARNRSAALAIFFFNITMCGFLAIAIVVAVVISIWSMAMDDCVNLRRKCMLLLATSVDDRQRSPMIECSFDACAGGCKKHTQIVANAIDERACRRLHSRRHSSGWLAGRSRSYTSARARRSRRLRRYSPSIKLSANNPRAGARALTDSLTAAFDGSDTSRVDLSRLHTHQATNQNLNSLE